MNCYESFALCAHATNFLIFGKYFDGLYMNFFKTNISSAKNPLFCFAVKKIRFLSILQKVSSGFAWNSLELLSEVRRIWAPRALGAKVKGPMGPNFSRTYFGDYLADFHDSKAVWKPLDPRCALVGSFSSEGPLGLKGAKIFSGTYQSQFSWFERPMN